MQSPQLVVRKAAIAVGNAPGQKKLLVVEQHLTFRRQVHIQFRGITQKFDDVGIALDKQVYEFIDRVDDGVRLIIDDLLKTVKPQDFRRTGRTTDVNILALDIRAVGATAADGQKQDVISQMFVGT